MRRKIVHVIESAAGGSFEYVRSLCDTFSSSLWEIVVVYSKRPDSPDRVNEMFPSHIKLIEMKMVRELSLTDVVAIYKLKQILLRENPDLVHLHSSKAGAVGRLASYGQKWKVVYTPHCFSFMQGLSIIKKRIFFAMEKCLAIGFPCYFLLGSRNEYDAAKSLTRSAKATLIYNAVETGHANDGANSNDFLCCTLGRITQAKNPELYLHIIGRLRLIYPNAQFLWIGDGEGRAKLEKNAEDMKVPLTITGWIAKDKVASWLKRSTVYVQTSDWEGLPFSLLEAMSYGKPVVASAIPSHKEVIESGIDGIIAKSPETFLEAIVKITSSAELREQLSVAAMDKIKLHFSREVFDVQIKAFYNKVLEGH